MSQNVHIAILGGGPAGLSVGYFARKESLPFTIYEAGDQPGGFGITHRKGEFSFDMGAHRFHDKDPEVTREIKELLGDDLVQIEVPSKIYDQGNLISFPLTPFDLILRLGPIFFMGAGLSLIKSRFERNSSSSQNFASFAKRIYGRPIADRFLFNYSEKLWGLPPRELSPTISGKRLKGLNLRTFLTEAILGQKKNTQHLEGAFYYPKRGFGMIVEAMSKYCGTQNIRLRTKVSSIIHDEERVLAIEINENERFPTDQVASTLPISLFVRMMEPKPPQEIIALADQLLFRNLILVVLFIRKPSITKYGTIYFPGKEFPFTRVSEPRNRSNYMSPPGKTSLLVEIPCDRTDEIWNSTDHQLIHQIVAKLNGIGWLREEEIIDTYIRRINFAYPILKLGYEEIVEEIIVYLKRFRNLKFLGRNGLYTFSSFHHQMQAGMMIVEEIKRDLEI